MSRDIYFLLAIFLTRTTAFSVTLSPGPPVEVPINSSVTFTCTTTYTMLFVRLTDEVYGLESDSRASVGNINNVCKTLAQHPNYSVNCTSVTGPYKFTIQSVTMDYHNKIVRCIVQYGINSKDDIAYADTRIMVEVPLESVNLTPNTTVDIKYGQVHYFRRSANSRPISSLSWHIGNFSPPTTASPPINEQIGDTIMSTLSYKAQKKDNNMTLYCTAYNGKDVITESVVLNILYRPTVRVFPIFNPYNVIENTTNIQLTCNVIDANPPVTSYMWYKDNSAIGTMAIYSITKVQYSNDGRYSCIAKNSVNRSDISSWIHLNVLYGLKINPIDKQQITDGKELNVTCSGQSNPPITDSDVTWTKQDNNTFKTTGRILLIPNVNRLDSGSYICSVFKTLTPSIGQSVNVSDRTFVEADIQYRPVVRVSPTFDPYNVIENTTNIELTCAVIDANPSVTSYIWYKNNSAIGTTAIYSITKVQYSDDGGYSCAATNSVNESDISSAIHLNILYGVKMTPIETQQIEEGNELSVRCSGKSNPPITDSDITWTKQGNITFSMTGRKLMMTKVKRVDSGIYICNVLKTLIPSIGEPVSVSGMTVLEVDVQYAPRLNPEIPSSPITITLQKGRPLNMTVFIISRPKPQLSWTFQRFGTNIKNNVDANDTFGDNEHYSSIYISQLDSTDVGFYVITSSNTLGSISVNFTVNIAVKPSSSEGIFAFCDSTSAVLIWKSLFNGGSEQMFYIKYWEVEEELHLYSSNISDQGENSYMNFTLYNMSPGKTYSFVIVSVNRIGLSHSKILGCTTGLSYNLETGLNNEQTIFQTGIALIVIGIFILLCTIGTCLVYRFLFSNRTIRSRSKEYNEVTSDNPVFTEAYESIGHTSGTGNETRTQTAISSETYEELQSKTPSDLHVYQSLQERGKVNNEKKTSNYANMIF